MASVQQHHRWLQGLIIAAGVTALASGAWATTYSAVNDFSIASNPNGVWSYIYTPFTPPTSPSVLLPTTVGSPGSLEGWEIVTGGETGNVIMNDSGTTQTYSTIVQPTNELNLGPGAEFSVGVAFTAPVAGLYSITGDFVELDTFATDHADVAIKVGGTGVYSDTLTSYGQDDPFDLLETLTLGESVHFFDVGGCGGITLCNGDAGLDVTITNGISSVPEPPTLALFGAALLGLGFIYRRRNVKIASIQ